MQGQLHINGNGNKPSAVSPSVNGNGSAIARPRVVLGRGVAHLGPDKRVRAVLAAQVADGAVILQPSVAQLARLYSVSVAYINRARKLSPTQRRAILLDSDSVPGVFRPTLHLVSPVPVNPAPADVDEALVRMVRTFGPERVFRAIESVV
jgi:hypothetical protein